MIRDWSNRVIRWGFYLLFIITPLILTPWNFELFEFNKMVVVYALTIIIIIAWIVKMLDEKELRIARTPLDIPIVLFVLSQLVSTLFSIDPHISWFGYYSRFNGGMFSIFSYVLLYYAFVTNFHIGTSGKETTFRLNRLVKVILTTAGVVALYGILEHFGIDKNLWVQDVQSRVFSTLGQPNWLAAYLVALIPVSITYVLVSKKLVSLHSIVWGVVAIGFFITLLFTRSRSGYLGLAIADLVFWGFLYLKTRNFTSLRIPLIAFHALIAVIVFINGTYIDSVDSWVTFNGWRNRLTHQQSQTVNQKNTVADTALESGGTESGTIREYVWQGAINAWRASTKNTAIGTGTETFTFAFYKYRPVGHNMTSEWDFLYNKAHNEYLNYLATTGLAGLGTYLLFIVAFIWWFIRQKHDELTTALFAGWASVLVTNFFGFSVVVMQLILFLFPAIILSLEMSEKPSLSFKLKPPSFVHYIVLLIGLLLLVGVYRYWKGDTYYASANRLERSGDSSKAQTFNALAISLNPGEPVYHDDYASVLATLALSAAQEKNATLAASLAKQSLNESNSAITTSPNNVNFWKTRTKLYYTFSTFDPELNAPAINALESAAALSPNDPKIFYNLAILYGREGNNEKALELLKKTKNLKPNYRDAYFGLYVFYSELKDPKNAKAILEEYLKNVDPTDKDFQDRLGSV